MSSRQFGWIKDAYDKRAWLYQTKPTSTIPDKWQINSKYLPTISDQGRTGSCVGQAMDGAVSCIAKQLGIFEESFSAWDIYKGALYLEGMNYDDGCYPSDALEWMKDMGILLEHYWPFIDGTITFDKKFRPSSMNEPAMKWKLNYFRAVDGINGIASMLTDNKPVPIGVPWPKRWMSTADGKLVEVKSSDQAAGGHEIWLWGYDLTIGVGYLYGSNSWGTVQWSSKGTLVPKGCFMMPVTAIDKFFKPNGGYDAHTIEVDWSKPVPVPPTPTTKELLLSLAGKELYKGQV